MSGDRHRWSRWQERHHRPRRTSSTTLACRMSITRERERESTNVCFGIEGSRVPCGSGLSLFPVEAKAKFQRFTLEPTQSVENGPQSVNSVAVHFQPFL